MFQKRVLTAVFTNITRKFHGIGVLGIPLDKGQTKPGVGLGPDAIRKELFGALRDIGTSTIYKYLTCIILLKRISSPLNSRSDCANKIQENFS